MKALIRRNKIHGYWQARFDNKMEWFITFEAATTWVKKTTKRYYKESVAFSLVESLAMNLLSVKETDFVEKLKKSRCRGITKAQYGYLRGIHERQIREW